MHNTKHVFDSFVEQEDKYVCWLYYKDNTMHCKLCEKFNKIKNINGKIKPEEAVDSFCYKVCAFIIVSLLYLLVI